MLFQNKCLQYLYLLISMCIGNKYVTKASFCIGIIVKHEISQGQSVNNLSPGYLLLTRYRQLYNTGMTQYVQDET